MNPYNVLNVRRNASENDINLAYTKLKQKYNKDNYAGDPYFAKKRLVEINKAYSILSDSKKRAKYDKEYITHINLHKSEESISNLENETSLSDDDSETVADNFIIFWVFFSIFAIFIIIPLVYVLSALSIFD